MFKWLENYNESSPQTKYFIICTLLFSSVIIVSLIYCFARLDFVRSYNTEQKQTENNQTINTAAHDYKN